MGMVLQEHPESTWNLRGLGADVELMLRST